MHVRDCLTLTEITNFSRGLHQTYVHLLLR